MPAGARRTLAATLAARRRFVGRAVERALFAEALVAEEPDFRVLFVHGPGGIGKSSLARAWQDLAEEAGRQVVRIDARDAAPSAEAVLAAIATDLGALAGEDPLAALPSAAVLVLDTYELLEPIDRWVREELVPALPADGFLVLAGRLRPHHCWRDDSALAAITRVLSLRNLDQEESDELLAPVVRDPDRRTALVAQTYGHPLGLALLADMHRQGTEAAQDGWRPDQMETLLATFVDSVPSPAHRRALDALAIARVTTEASLRHVLADPDEAVATSVFAWLRGLSFVDTGPEGLFPHDLARDAFVADLRWRDPASLRALVRASLEHAVADGLVATTGLAQQRKIFDFQYLFRAVPALRTAWDWTTFGLVRAEPATDADRASVLAWFERWEGAASAAHVARWWDLQPEGVVVIRDTFGETRGAAVTVDLTGAAPEDIAADPVATAAWAHIRRTRPPVPGEIALLHRSMTDRDHHHRSSATMNMGGSLVAQSAMLHPNLGWSLTAPGNPEIWDGVFASVGFQRVPGPAIRSGNAEVNLYAHDFATVPLDRWMDRMIEVVAAAFVDPDTAPLVAASIALSYEEFTAAVKDGLRHLHRPDRLALNPLSRSRIADDAASLAEVLREAVADVGKVARTHKLHRALDRTYVRPAATQERAAEVLGLPFSTYRRHLTSGVEQVAGALWQRELYGE